MPQNVSLCDVHDFGRKAGRCNGIIIPNGTGTYGIKYQGSQEALSDIATIMGSGVGQQGHDPAGVADEYPIVLFRIDNKLIDRNHLLRLGRGMPHGSSELQSDTPSTMREQARLARRLADGLVSRTARSQSRSIGAKAANL
jgi:hypothetical protein